MQGLLINHIFEVVIYYPKLLMFVNILLLLFLIFLYFSMLIDSYYFIISIKSFTVFSFVYFSFMLL